MIPRGVEHVASAPLRRLDRILGGSRRRRVIVPLAAVLALQTADASAVGADATQLEAGLHINEAQIGLLLSVSVLVGAVMTLPAGVLVDRIRRTRLLGWAVATWGVAMALSALAADFRWLLLSRLALGAVTAVAGPATASLIGDSFPPHERGRIYSYVLCGELIGAGFGLVVAGELAVLSWRAPFIALILPSALVCWMVLRLDEPGRGAQQGPTTDDGSPARQHSWSSLPAAVRYVLSIRTNVVLIIASMLGYLFLSGLRGFAVQFTTQHYGVSHSLAVVLALIVGLSALGGVIAGGRLADTLQRRGRPAARVEIPGIAVVLCALLFVPALITTTVWVALPLLALASACLGATTAPLDAARLDVVVAPIWGRAEAIRTVLRDCGEAGGPLLFGLLASSVFVGPSALAYAFMVTLLALLAEAALLLLIGRRTYPRDRARARAAHSVPG